MKYITSGLFYAHITRAHSTYCLYIITLHSGGESIATTLVEARAQIYSRRNGYYQARITAGGWLGRGTQYAGGVQQLHVDEFAEVHKCTSHTNTNILYIQEDFQIFYFLKLII